MGIRSDDSRFSDGYSSQMREEQKALLNGLLGIIYDNYDSTRRIQGTVDSVYRIVVTLLVIIIILLVIGILIVCYFGCKRYQTERESPLHHTRKSAPIEI